MRKIVYLILVIILLLGTLTGCGQKKGESIYEADNEIFTYQRIDPDKTQIIVSRTGNIPVMDLCEAFQASNPDIQVVYVDITGGNGAYTPLTDWVTSGNVADVVMTASGLLDDATAKEFFVDLSENPIIRNYEADALQRTAVDGHVYWLPGPSNICAMMYNKTLFDRYGWKVPATFDAFIALCDQIREDTNGEVEPWNPNAKYEGELLTALQAFSYEELMGGVDNRVWYNDLLAGNATFGEHMKPYFDMVQTLIDHGILREEHFTYSATTRGNEFSDGKIAMINMNIYDADNETYDFSLMPFPATKGELGYVCDIYSYYAGLPKKEHTEKETEAINRFLAYFSSPEGQTAYIGKTLKISNVKGVALDQSGDIAALQPAVDAGHMFGLLDYKDEVSGKSRVSLSGYISDMVKGDRTGSDCLAAIDERLKTPEEAVPVETPEIVATVSEGLTILETSFLFADAYRAATGADIGLISNNEAYRGNLMRMYPGDISAKMLTVFKPRSFANGSTLVKVSMTGRQIMDALNNPTGYNQSINCIYAYSGLKCEVAPWRELGSKYISVKLADGSALDLGKLYTVAVWAGTVADEYITETLETYEGSWEEIMTSRLKAIGTIKPVNDGRIKLVWD